MNGHVQAGRRGNVLAVPQPLPALQFVEMPEKPILDLSFVSAELRSQSVHGPIREPSRKAGVDHHNRIGVLLFERCRQAQFRFSDRRIKLCGCEFGFEQCDTLAARFSINDLSVRVITLI
jgi:hypothetical protein